MAVGEADKLALGLDAGSVALKAVVIGAAGDLRELIYARTHGRPLETSLRVLEELLARYGAAAFDLVAGTGSAGRLLCELLAVPFVNEVICQATAIKHLHPEARTLLEMGGQDAKLIYLPDGPANGRPLTDFVMNTNCAAGTGSFLDQQAARLGVAIEEEFGKLALASLSPPRVAGRCSVFAKSDMIHLQQQAAPVHDIVAGLCLGLARNLKSNLGRGASPPKPIAFCGGVAANAGVVRALETVFELAPGELIVPAAHAGTGALGAVLVARKQQRGKGPARPLDLTPLRSYLANPPRAGHTLAPLDGPRVPRPSHPGAAVAETIGAQPGSPRPSGGFHNDAVPTRADLEARVARSGLIDAYLGLDVGSISTKIAVIDDDHRVLAKIYLMTAGRPLDAVRQVLEQIGQQVDGLVRIRGAATTGSGRYLTGDFIGADLVINEITAQATAAAALDPEVDTIFEIGGQDSKYISLDGGVVVDFEMNHACAAGTGSFLEEQAGRLGVSIKGEFSRLALESRGPIRLGERCTVFMESDLISHQQQGAATPDFVAGLCYSIVTNYLNRVVGHRRIGKRIFFQGGTAFNGGVVAAFAKVTGRNITVPPHHEVTGAMGAAILARRAQNARPGVVAADPRVSPRPQSKFGGFAFANQSYQIRSFECAHCSNACEINEVTYPGTGRPPLSYGSRCDRYNVKQDRGPAARLPDLFAERQRLLRDHAHLAPAPRPGRPRVGIPLALANHQLLPFWSTLLGELGVNVVLSRPSNPDLIHRGVEAVLSTPCFPVKVAHGHVLDLLEQGVDFVWLPTVVTMRQDYPENPYNQLCPYVTSIASQIEAALGSRGIDGKLLKPVIRFQQGPKAVYRGLLPLRAALGVGRRALWRAVEQAWAAQDAFEEACRARGREVLAGLTPDQRAVVIVSRPYNGCDRGVCLDLPAKLRRLDVLPIPMDYLDLRAPDPTGDRVLSQMYWKYGQRILHAAQMVQADPRLHAVYLSNFSCGPDSFLLGFFKRLMAPKPALVLEIDEHSADAGVVTRLEAFLESLSHAPAPPPASPAPTDPTDPTDSAAAPAAPDSPAAPTHRLPLYPPDGPNGHPRTWYLPWMGDVSDTLAAALRGSGQPAEVIPPADAQSLETGRRHCSGKECLPCIITTGDMIRVTQRPGFDPARAAFFMPGGSGPCRFGQYNAMHKLVLSDLGLGAVPVISLSQDKEFYDQCRKSGSDPARLAWVGMCASDLLTKVRLALRPYEQERGSIERVYQDQFRRVCGLLETCPRDAEVIALLRQAAAAFAAVAVDRRQRKPRIGIVGEIYVRLHTFANQDLIGQLEAFGAEVTVACFGEWIYYCNWSRQGESRRDGSLRHWVVNYLTDRVQHHIERRLAAPLEELVGPLCEPPIADVLTFAAPYLDPAFEGEAILSIGKMIELHRHGCHGVINVMPFTCMPSTIVGAVMKRVTAALGPMPALSVSFDGHQDPTLTTRLEAFLYQARAYQGGSIALCRSPRKQWGN